MTRATFALLGLVFVGLGFAGAILPGMPATIFFILALACFRKGSERLENWLLAHKWVGPTLRDWERNGSIKRRTKIVALVMLWVCLLVSAWLTHSLVGWLVLTSTGLAVSAYIVTRPDADNRVAAEAVAQP